MKNFIAVFALVLGFLSVHGAYAEKESGAWSDIKSGTLKVIRGAAKGVKKGASHVEKKIDKNMDEDAREEAAEQKKKK